ncbi:MAG TPA: hypothetical protein VGI92_00655, partial [Gemmatimonadales bacterium]
MRKDAAPLRATTLSVQPGTTLNDDIGDQNQLVVTALDSASHPIAGAPVIYAVSDTSIADVSIEGLVSAKRSGHVVIHLYSLTAFLDVQLFIRDYPHLQYSRIPLSGRPYGLAVSPFSELYVTRRDSNSVVRIRESDGLVLGTAAVGSDPVDVSFSVTRGEAYALNVASQTVTRITTSNMLPSGTFYLSAEGARCLLSMDQGSIFVATTGAMERIATSTLAGSSLPGNNYSNA